ncbi:MAG: hypothetical protein WC938_02010 [Candidatus Paceibacterota bacterium]|jgi:hypothetical protein
MKNIFRKQFLFFALLLITSPLLVKADNLGQHQNFFVDPNYSDSQKIQVSADLVRNSDKANFYIDANWLSQKTDKEKESIYSTLSILGTEFDSNIYPQLTSIFGHELTPGIDKDTRITILFYSMKENARGYVRNIDEYDRLVNPFSNQREIVYLNVDNITNPLMKAFLAHEFMHLINFNQKDLTQGVSEDIWLNEARAEYAPTLLGYNNDNNFDYLSNRIKSFIDNSSDSLVEWNNASADYGITSIFVHYLVDQYGLNVLIDSLKSKQVGINSINEALLKEGVGDNFNDAFTNFIIAVYLNNCDLSSKYCFKNKNLTDLHVLPFINFLPFSGESNLNLGQYLKNYSAHWQKFSGGSDNLKIVFKNQSVGQFVVPYIIKNVDGISIVKFLKIDSSSKTGELVVQNINKDVSSVIVMPSIQILDAVNQSLNYNYSIAASSFVNTESNSNQGNNNNQTDTGIKLPFLIDKPLNQMNREELLMVLLKVIIYLVTQGKLTF